jgi:O-antigen/teichoic acid export membrane protein
MLATRSGIVLLLIDLASFVVGRGDVWLAAVAFEPAAALRYSTASLVAFQITVPMGLANVALSPIAVRMWKDQAWDQLRKKVDSVAAMSVALTSAATLIFWVAGPFVVGFVYGSPLRSAWLPLAILATGTIVFSAWGGSSVLLIVSGHGREAAVTGLVVLAVIIPMAALTAAFAGPTALALASSLATCCLVGSQKWCAKHYVGFAPSPLRGLGFGHSRREPLHPLLDNTATR